MRDELRDILNNVSQNNKLNVAREYLQSYLLLLLQRFNFFRMAAFVGGTCLRIVHGIPRFSEDLDFSLLMKKEDFQFIDLIKFMKIELGAAGYALEVTYKDNSNVYNAMIKFEGIMYEFGISKNVTQKLFLKLDIDVNPPPGAILETSLVTKFFPLTIVHYDIPSILAGKMNALFTRPYAKGRDYFDIFWILSRYEKVSPNINLLNNALSQFNYPETITAKNWAELLGAVIRATNMSSVQKDVAPFMENSHFLTSFNPEGFDLLLGRYR